MADGHPIQLHDFIIGTPLPLPKLLCHPSRLALKFSVNGVSEKEILSTREGAEDGIWEIDGDVKVYEDQWLTAIILVCVEGSTKELGTATVSYSQLLAHAEARSKECYEFTMDESTPSVLILVTCSIGISVPLSQKQHIFAEPVLSPGTSKPNEGHSSNNRPLISDASATPSIADLERRYSQATSLPAEHKSEELNAVGRAYIRMYKTTNEMVYLEKAISICDEALQNTSSHPRLPLYFNALAVCLVERFHCTGSHDDIELAVSKSHNAVHIAKNNDPDRHIYILNHANALLERYGCLGKVEDLQSGVSFMNTAVGLVSDGHPDKPACLNLLGVILQRQFNCLGCIEDLELAIVYKQMALNLTSDGDPEKTLYFEGLGSALERRFEQFGRVDDLETAIVHKQKAVDLTPDGHPDKPFCFYTLSIAVGTRFHRLGRVEDLETAIAHGQRAIDLAPDGHPKKPACHDNLGIAFLRRFDRLGHVEDLEMAIAHNQKAVDLTPEGHPRKPGRLTNLGNTFEARFDQLGRVDDLEIAIAHGQRAVLLTLDGHPDKPTHFNYLGNTFGKRFHRLGRIENLERAIAYNQQAVNWTLEGHPQKPKYLNDLGTAFETRFIKLGHVEDLETAIKHKQKAFDLMPDGHASKPGYLYNLGCVLETRFDHLDNVEDLEIAIAYMQNAAGLIPDTHLLKPGFLNKLGNAFKKRFNRLYRIEDLEIAVIQFSIAASLPTGSPTARLIAAMDWANASGLLAALREAKSSPLEPYHVAVDLLPRIAWLGIPMSTQHAFLEKVGGIVRDAVSAAIEAGKYETAVEWLEAGRSIAWQNLLNLRTPVNELRSAHSDLADRLETISRQLNTSVRRSDGTINVATVGMENSRSHVQLALDWDNTVADIRSKPGFESFLKPKRFKQLGRIARDGPVVILNIDTFRCDALVLIPEDNGNICTSNIPLSDSNIPPGGFTYAKSEALLKELKGLLLSKHLRDREPRKPIRRPIDGGKGSSLEHILSCLWLDVVKPIIDALAYQPRSTGLPHIWWCATGPLALLPIHAAGLYNTDEPGNKLSDYVVSSYTPTLSALLDDSTTSLEDFRLLAVAQANAPGASSIPETEVEVKKIQTLAENINVATMTKEEATVENVWRGMEKSNWVHLACHGYQNVKEPMKSGLLLHDGTLELQRLIEKTLPHADFAFLSACQTATGDESMAEESLHLASGMLFAGYKGVIATMWSIMDDVGPRVAEDVYRVMLKDGKPNRKAAAHALHEAVKRLREDPKVDMLHWVPFIHIGL